jgi:6-phosphogluconolactonase
MASEQLLNPLGINRLQIHRMQGEADDLARAAAEYEARIRRIVPDGAEDMPRFDLVLLGMGDDGHTASLFPGTKGLDEERLGVVANHIPQRGTWRLTMTLPLINQSRAVWFLVTGASKASRLGEVLKGQDGARYPCELVRPELGELRWIVDRPAAEELLRGTFP